MGCIRHSHADKIAWQFILSAEPHVEEITIGCLARHIAASLYERKAGPFHAFDTPGSETIKALLHSWVQRSSIAHAQKRLGDKSKGLT